MKITTLRAVGIFLLINMALPSKKSPDEVLQEELLHEKAAVLGRAGDKLLNALDILQGIERRLNEHLGQLKEIERSIAQDCACGLDLEASLRRVKGKINGEIERYNGAREDALEKYYYLIVTREAMGLRRHHWVERLYPVPPRKKSIQDA